MECVPHVFVESVLHAMTSASISPLSQLANCHWKKLAEMHSSRREDYHLLIAINRGATHVECFSVSGLKTVDFFRIPPDQLRYVRIQSLAMDERTPLFRENLPPTLLNLKDAVDKLLSYKAHMNAMEILRCDLYTLHPELDPLWKKKFSCIQVGRYLKRFAFAITSWHLKNNENLQRVKLRRVTRRIMDMSDSRAIIWEIHTVDGLREFVAGWKCDKRPRSYCIKPGTELVSELVAFMDERRRRTCMMSHSSGQATLTFL